MAKPVTLAIVGAGNRGHIYAGAAREWPADARVVAVAEPRPAVREALQRQYAVPPERVYEDWRTMAAAPRLADAVVIATQDADHLEPARAFLELGYSMLLEKPMAPSEEECQEIAAAAERAGTVFAVAHVLLYTPYTRKLMGILEAGVVGRVTSLQHHEPIGSWHFAHSYVRGNWRCEAESSFLLLTKCCHDLDWIRHVMGAEVRAVASFGSLEHFHPGNRPEGATERCLDCPARGECPYDAERIYLGRVRDGSTGWPVSVLTEDPDEGSVTRALREGPYGECVYLGKNDVVDNQVVALEFEDGRSASFHVSAFTPFGARRTTIFGTHGQVTCDGERIGIQDFRDDSPWEVAVPPSTGPLAGHCGGDEGLIRAFLKAVASGDPSGLHSGAADSLASHRVVFAAELARRSGEVVRL